MERITPAAVLLVTLLVAVLLTPALPDIHVDTKPLAETVQRLIAVMRPAPDQLLPLPVVERLQTVF